MSQDAQVAIACGVCLLLVVVVRVVQARFTK